MTRPWQGIIGSQFSAEGFDDYCRSLGHIGWPSFLVVHNTAVPSLRDWHDVTGATRMRGLVRYYRDDLGWSAGPHLFVADDGIWIFTPLSTPGVHSPSWNAESWGVELVGDYNREPFNDEVRENALSAMASLHRLAGWTEPSIRFHRDDPETTHTTCPGRNVDRVQIEAGIATYLELNR